MIGKYYVSINKLQKNKKNVEQLIFLFLSMVNYNDLLVSRTEAPYFIPAKPFVPILRTNKHWNHSNNINLIIFYNYFCIHYST